MQFAIGAALLLALTAAACSGEASSTTTTPTTSSAALVTETFTGTVPVGGSDFHNFSLAAAGSLSVTLTAATPPATIWMGLGVGTPSTSACALLTNGAVVTQAGATSQLSGTVVAGSYCVQVYDVGNQTSPVTYSVTVAHP